MSELEDSLAETIPRHVHADRAGAGTRHRGPRFSQAKLYSEAKPRPGAGIPLRPPGGLPRSRAGTAQVMPLTVAPSRPHCGVRLMGLLLTILVTTVT